jgi:hypothetical protein
MPILTSSKLTRARAVTILTLAGAVCTFLAAGVDPAMALCKYGTPHCVNPHPGPSLPTVGGAQIPDSGWEDPDCQYYHSCGFAGMAVHQPGRTTAGGKITVK